MFKYNYKEGFEIKTIVLYRSAKFETKGTISILV